MSFTSDVKSELCKTRPSDRHAEAECYGMLLLCRSFDFNKILFQTGSEAAANRFILLLKQSFGVVAELSAGGTSRKTYSVSVDDKDDLKRILHRLGYRQSDEILLKPEVLKIEGSIGAFVRGAFLAGGTLSNPETEYRIDFSFKTEGGARDFSALLLKRGIVSKITKRANKYLVYIKDSAMLGDVLAFMGAGNETLNLINVKIYKSVKNRINRENNCETRNILKSADAAFAQIKAIKKLKRRGKLELLPEELLEAAALRLANPEASLADLCRISGNRLTRSGLNHRLKRICEIADEVK